MRARAASSSRSCRAPAGSGELGSRDSCLLSRSRWPACGCRSSHPSGWLGASEYPHISADARVGGKERNRPVSSSWLCLCVWLMTQTGPATPAVKVEFNRYQGVLSGLHDPVSVAVDEAGHIYVVERTAHQV